MGSIIKKPKAPKIQYVAPQSAATVTIPTTTAAATTPIEPVKTTEQIQTEARTDSLLQRTRGRLGTIATSFRGFLDSIENYGSKRKSLLGE